MRSRLFSIFRQHLNSLGLFSRARQFSSPPVATTLRNTTLAAITLAATTGYLTYKNKKKTQFQITNIDELNTEIQRIQKLLPDTSDKVEDLSMAIINSIQHNDLETFKYEFNHLNTLVTVSKYYNSSIINLCAALGKYSFLKFLAEECGLSNLIKNNITADQLLKHPAGNLIEYISNQFISGVGSIKGDGANALMDYLRMNDINRALQNIKTVEPTSPDNIECDLNNLSDYNMLRIETSQHEKNRYTNLAFIEVTDNKTLSKYLNKLKSLNLETSHTISGTLMLYGGHFTCVNIEVSKLKDEKQCVKMLYIDSLGGDETVFRGDFVATQIEMAFPSAEKKYYQAEYLSQHATKGCSVFSLYKIYQLAHIDEVPNLHKPFSIFDYCGENTTTTSNKCDVWLFDLVTDEYSESPTQIKFNTCLLPLSLVTMTQNYNTQKEIDIYDEEWSKIIKSRIPVGHLGLNDQVQESPPKRQREASPEFWKTVTEFTKKDNVGRLYNNGTNEVIARWGLELANNLIKLTPEQLTSMLTAFTVDNMKIPETQKNNSFKAR